MITQCYKCNLHLFRKNIVNGDGQTYAPIMIIGEAPGYYEDKLGKPFVGESGKELDRFLNIFNFKRGEDVYLTNIVKCRPPNNETPMRIQINKCLPYLIKEIEDSEAKIILLLGNTALTTFFGEDKSISKCRGQIYPIIMKFKRYFIPMYHPSYLLRNKEAKLLMYNDFCKVLEIYRYLIDKQHSINF